MYCFIILLFLFMISGCDDWTNDVSPLVGTSDQDSQVISDPIPSTVDKIFTFSESTKELRSSCFSPDSSKLLLGSHEGVAILCDIKSGKKLYELNKHTYPIIYVRFSPDGKFALTIGEDNIACIWDVDSGLLQYSLEIDYSLGKDAVIFFPDSKFLLHTVNNNVAGIVTICEIISGKPIQKLKGHTKSVTSVCLSSDGKKVITGSFDKTIRIWDVATGQELQKFVDNEYQSILAFFSPDNKLFLVQDGLHSKNIKIWDLNAEKQLYKLQGQWFNDFDYGMERAYFSHDSKKVLTLFRLIMLLRIWDMDTGKVNQILNDVKITLSHCSFSLDDKFVLLVGHYEIMLWEVDTGKTRILWDDSANRFIKYARFSHDSSLVVSANEDNVIRLIDVISGNKLFADKTQDRLIRVYFSPDNNFVLAECKHSALIWNISSARKEIIKKNE
jgi:WD40 repeat protein